MKIISFLKSYHESSTRRKLFMSFMLTVFLLLIPYLVITIYLAGQAHDLRTLIIFLTLFTVCAGTAMFFSYYTIIRPVSNISSAASRIFEDYIEASIMNTDEVSDEQTSNVSDDTIRLMHHVQHLMDKEYTAEMLRKQAELDALQSQINPHFLYNTLESIRGQAVYEGVDTIADMAKSLSDFFRYSIQSKKPLVQLKEEFHIVDSYIKIQNYRFHDKYKIELALDEDTLLNAGIPRLTLQPLVENALLHGLHNSINPVEIVKISAYRTQKRLVITVSDRGCGIPDKALDAMNQSLSQPLAVNVLRVSTSKSIGLNNINERIKLHYGNEYGIKLYSALNYGTTVELSLPVSQPRDAVSQNHHEN